MGVFDEIEFDCTECGVGLSMPRDAAGEDVDCPECGIVLRVPPQAPTSLSNAAGPSRGASAVSARSPVDVSPVCVICGSARDLHATRCDTCGTPYHIDFLKQRRRPRGIFVGEILATSTKLFVQRLNVLVPAILIEMLVTLLLVLIPDAVARMANGPNEVAAVGASLLFVLMIYHGLRVGHYRLMFAVARGESVKGHEVLLPIHGDHYARSVAKMLFVSSMFWIATLVGALFGLIPGMVFALLAWPCGRVVVDRDVPVLLAISQSIDLTVPHWPGVLSVTSLLFAIQFAIGLVAVGVGQVLVPLIVLLLVSPFSSLVLTVMYLRLSDEPTAADGPPPADEFSV